ncbi:MAG: PilZ domain-containing protein [Desulfuromonadales bacterium]
MKSILVADNRPDLLATLEPILKHWGYRVLSARKIEQVMAFLQESSPCLLIIGEALFADRGLVLAPGAKQRIDTGELPVIALKQDGEEITERTPSETLEVPVELFELYSFIQCHVERHPRQNLRLRLRLPGMYRIGDNKFILADVLNLSMHGLFFKATTRVKKGDRVTVIFPLFGHCKEIEVKATVLYTIQPEVVNNFFQGFGVGFDCLPDDQKGHLHTFIREHFLREVSSSRNGVGDFAETQLKV